jgi:predicted O-methyltransferase YrrM
LILGDASAVIAQLEGPFDMILQDSDKALYPLLLDRCVDLTREYGVIIADDALFKPRGIPDKFSAPVHRYNELVFADPRLLSTILPIGDGITVSVKIGGQRTK